MNKIKLACRNSWTLDPSVGRCTLDAGLWTLDPARWTLDAGLWTLNSGLRTLGVKTFKNFKLPKALEAMEIFQSLHSRILH